MREVSKKRKDFLWVGNDASLDLLNTEIIQDGVRIDLLDSPADYIAWLTYAGFNPHVVATDLSAEAGLKLVKRFRAQLRESLERWAQGSQVPRSLLDVVNEYLRSGRTHSKLVQDGNQLRLEHSAELRFAMDFVTPVVKQFADFIVHADRDRLRKCRNEDCILWFYDTSKSGTRAWCSLELCGNKMRMAASRKRRTRH